jgi:protein-disulfide isomerase
VIRAGAIAAVVALGLIAPMAAAKPAVKAQAAHDWSRTVAMTPEGGFRMGNPAAKVKLVEYGSLACPHCRHFEQTGLDPLVDQYVRTGKVSYEFRNLLINGPDIAVSLLARCAGPAKFFPMSRLVYATQPQWEARIQGMSDADKAALEGMTDQQRILLFATLGGLPQIAGKAGMPPARAQQCLADAKGLKQLLDMTQAAMDRGIHRTPTFIVDGKVTDAGTWDRLEPLIREAGGWK